MLAAVDLLAVAYIWQMLEQDLSKYLALNVIDYIDKTAY
jgi:hypothetical protein